MSIGEQLTTSFIKGIGKAAAAIVVMGVVTGVWYVSQNTNSMYPQKKRQEQSSQTVQMEEINQTTPESETCELEPSKGDANDVKSKYRRLFDKFDSY
jgi:hypothetical protein